MNYLEIAQRIDKSPSNEDWINTEEIGNELGVDISYVNQERLKAYWLGSWQCTDTTVGYKVYFLDDEPVAFSSQSGRKSDEYFKWFGLDNAQKVKEYLLSLLLEEESKLNIEVCDLNDELGIGYQIQFNSQVLNSDNVYHKGEKVEVISFKKTHPFGIDTSVTIKLPSGEEKEVEINKLTFGFYLAE